MQLRDFKNLFVMGGEVNLPKPVTTAISVCGLVLILVVWYFISYFEVIPTTILPNPVKVIASYGSLYENNNLIANTWFSIRLNLMCYVYALLISIPVGFFISLFPINDIIIGRYINSIRYIPVPCLSGIFIAIAGLTFNMKCEFLTFGLIIYIIPLIVSKVQMINSPSNDKENVYVQSIKTLGATPWQKFRYVYFPYTMGSISNDIITLTGISWSYLVIAEMIYKSGISGIGSLISVMSRQAHMAEVYALLGLIILIGILQDVMFKWIDRKIFPWKY
jgi:NitT/TauT family transport system permease protein